MIKLKEYVENISDIEAIDYLLESFENLEEKLNEFSKNRQLQSNKLKYKRLEKSEFDTKIKLDRLEGQEKDPDENDRIYRMGKTIFSGEYTRYKKQNEREVKNFKNLIQPKKDPKKLKAYNI